MRAFDCLFVAFVHLSFGRVSLLFSLGLSIRLFMGSFVVCACPSVCLRGCPHVCQPGGLYHYPFIVWPIRPFVCLKNCSFGCLSICTCVCLFVGLLA